VGRENDTRAECKTSSRSPAFLKIYPVCLGVSDAIALLLETVQTPAGKALFDDSLILRVLG